MSFIVATNVVASQPPGRRLTGTPHARANHPHKLQLWFFPSKAGDEQYFIQNILLGVRINTILIGFDQSKQG